MARNASVELETAFVFYGDDVEGGVVVETLGGEGEGETVDGGEGCGCHF
jgi:hypothetical protein